jgi:NTE family protein
MKVGLALSGGGARGFAHLGVLRVLEDEGIPVDFIAGTSAGSFVGGAVAAGLTAREIIKAGGDISWFSIAGLSYSPRGILSNGGITKFVEKHFPVTRFEDLRTPFAAVACDIDAGAEVVLKGAGEIAPAIRASCAIPGVFTPVQLNGKQLVDGGVVSPVPVTAVREMGADIIIAVDLLACGSTFRGTPLTALGMLFQSAITLLRAASRAQHYQADVVIVPPIAHIRPDEMRKRDELLELGEKAGREKIEEIKELVRNSG